MTLKSKLLSPDKRLNACEVDDSAHVQRGDRGAYVGRVQDALRQIDNAAIADAELSTGNFGPSTAAAVLRYKTTRQIINRTRQSTPDAVVGKMTIRRLDDDMLDLERAAGSALAGGQLRPFYKRLT